MTHLSRHRSATRRHSAGIFRHVATAAVLALVCVPLAWAQHSDSPSSAPKADIAITLNSAGGDCAYALIIHDLPFRAGLDSSAIEASHAVSFLNDGCNAEGITLGADGQQRTLARIGPVPERSSGSRNVYADGEYRVELDIGAHGERHLYEEGEVGYCIIPAAVVITHGGQTRTVDATADFDFFNDAPEDICG